MRRKLCAGKKRTWEAAPRNLVTVLTATAKRVWTLATHLQNTTAGYFPNSITTAGMRETKDAGPNRTTNGNGKASTVTSTGKEIEAGNGNITGTTTNSSLLSVCF